MAKQKLSKSERAQLDAAVETLRRALADGEKAQKEDDECEKAAKAASATATIKGIAQRDGAGAAILAIRAGGGRSISDQVHGRKDEE